MAATIEDMTMILLGWNSFSLITVVCLFHLFSGFFFLKKKE